MASTEDVISTKDPEAIRKKRSNIKRVISATHNNLVKLLEKTGGKFDHARIQRIRVLQDLAKQKKQQESFEMIHEAYMYFREEAKDETKEEALLLEQEEYYNEVIDKLCESL